MSLPDEGEMLLKPTGRFKQGFLFPGSYCNE